MINKTKQKEEKKIGRERQNNSENANANDVALELWS